LFEMLEMARSAGIRAVHVETDLVGAPPDAVDRLFESPIDLVSVHIPATSVSTYAKAMGVDALAEVIGGVNRFINRNRHLPLLVPTFVKCRDNLAEMEAWYDYWLNRVSAAVIAGPSDFAGLIEDVGVADMSPPLRVGCRRLASRITVLSDGRVVSCEQDVHGRQAMGVVGEQSIEEIWHGRMEQLRGQHACGRWESSPVCAKCREWHRP
jgi:radical SAM protein with 4Fe4S-binding SPASM domain